MFIQHCKEIPVLLTVLQHAYILQIMGCHILKTNFQIPNLYTFDAYIKTVSNITLTI